MNLRDSLLAVADDAPLGESGVDVGSIVRRGRRARRARRAGAAGLALTAVLGAIWVAPAVTGGSERDAVRAASRPKAAEPESVPLKLDKAALSSVTRGAQGDEFVLELRNRAGTPELPAYMVIRLKDKPTGDPCAAMPGGGNGPAGAPAPEDKCTKVVRPGGAVVWIRRWGHSPAHRPQLGADVQVVEGFHWTGGTGKVLVLTVTNSPQLLEYRTGRAQGPKFEVSDEDIAELLTAPSRPGWLRRGR